MLHHARASIVASGTATVEAALIGNPFIVVYRISPLSYAVAKRVVDVPHVAMVNLIAGKRIVPELIQGDFTATMSSHISDRCCNNEDARARMQANLRQVGEMLRSEQSAAGRVARDHMRDAENQIDAGRKTEPRSMKNDPLDFVQPSPSCCAALPGFAGGCGDSAARAAGRRAEHRAQSRL